MLKGYYKLAKVRLKVMKGTLQTEKGIIKNAEGK